MGMVFAVASGKGGVGKTSVVAGIGACLAALGRRTLCIDADVGLRNLDIVLGLSDKTAMDFGDVLRGDYPLEKALVEHEGIPNLVLLNAPLDLTPKEVSGFPALVRTAAQDFDFCLIDCPAGLGQMFRAAAEVCDQALIVTTPDLTSLRDASRAVASLEDFGVRRTFLVVNRVRPGLLKKQAAPNIDDAMDTTGISLIGVIPEDERVIASQNHAQSIIFGPARGAALAYYNIARRLLGERVPLMKIKSW